MRRRLFGLLAALLVITVPLGGALALEAKQLREDIIAGLELFVGPMAAAPVTYEVDGTQYFAIAAGRSIVTVALDQQKVLDSTN
jgi:hypothetical protein